MNFYRELGRSPFGIAVAALMLFSTACGPDSSSPVAPASAPAAAAPLGSGAATIVPEVAAQGAGVSLIENLRAKALPVQNAADAARVRLKWTTTLRASVWQWRYRASGEA